MSNFKWLSILMLMVMVSCTPKKSIIDIKRSRGIVNVTVSSVSVRADQRQLSLTGTDLDRVQTVKVTGPGVNQTFQIDSKSSGQLDMSAMTAGLKFVGDALYSLVLSTAAGDTTIPITFSPSNLGANTGDVLQWDGTNWNPIPMPASGINLKGTWDASGNNTSDTKVMVNGGFSVAAAPESGDYYIVSVGGGTTIDGESTWNAGDWIIFNGTSWSRINNTTGVSSFNSRTGAVSPQVGDYDFSMISNVVTGYMDYRPNATACLDGEVLKYDATNNRWDCGVDIDTSSGGTVTSVTAGSHISVTGTAADPVINVTVGAAAGQIPVLDGTGKLATSVETDPTVVAFAKTALPTCGVGEVLKSDGTSFSCVLDANTSLSEAAVEGYIANDVTTNYIPFDNGTKLVDSALYMNGLDLEANANFTVLTGKDVCIQGGNCLSGMSSTLGTVTNIATGTGLTGGPITSTGTISIAAGGVSGTELAAGAVTDAKVTDVGVDKIINGAAKYFVYRPNNVACLDGEILKWDNTNSRWICAADTNTTLSGSAAGGDLSGTYPNPTIAAGAVTDAKVTDVGVDKIINGAGKYFFYRPNNVACLDGEILKWDNVNSRWACGVDIDSTLSGAAAGGDLTGTYPNPTIAAGAVGNLEISDVNVGKIANNAGEYLLYKPNNVACADGEVLKWDNVNSRWICGADIDTDTTLSGAAAGGDLSGTYPNPTIAAGAVTDAKVTSVGVDKIINGAGKYLVYRPNDVACLDGEILKWDNTNSRWACGVDANSGGTGSVTSIIGGAGLSDGPITTSGTLDVQVDAATIEVNVSDQLQVKDGGISNIKISDVNVGKIANNAGEYFLYRPNNVACTDGQILSWDNTNSRWICATDADTTLSGAAAGGDLTGTYPNPTIAALAVGNAEISDVNIGKIQNNAGEYFLYKPNNVACADGEILIWDNTNSRWVCASNTDVGNFVIASYVVGADTAIANTDTVVGAFGKTQGQIDAIKAAYVKKAGDEMSGALGLGTAGIDASAQLQMDSTSQGFLPPRMTAVQRDAIVTPAAGLVIYNTDENALNHFDGSNWQSLASDATYSAVGLVADVSVNTSDFVLFDKTYFNNSMTLVNSGEGTTLKAGQTYRLEAQIAIKNGDNAGDQILKYQFHNGTINFGIPGTSTNGANDVKSSPAIAIYTPVADEVIKLQVIDDSIGTNGKIDADGSFLMVQEVVRGSVGAGGALAPNSVTSAHIVDGAIVTDDLSDGSVTTAKLATDAVTTAKIINGAVTIDKLDLTSTTQGITVTNMTEVQRDAIATPLAGMIIFNTTTNKLNIYATGAWGELSGGGVSGTTGDLTTATSGVGFPTMDTAARDALTPSEGLVIYNTDSKSLNIYSDGSWSDMKTDLTSLGFIPDVVETAGAGRGYCALLSDKTVYCWGYNGHGAVGNGNTTNIGAPTLVMKADGTPLNDAVDIDAGRYHNCAATVDGSVYCWGYAGNYNLGLGNTTNKLYANQVPGITTAISVGLYDEGSCALLADGTLKCWGYNSHGQVGDGTTAVATTPKVNTFVNNVKKIDGGRLSMCALKNDNSLWCWGYNEHGQLGNGGTTNSTNSAVLTLTNVKDFEQGSAWYYNGTAHYYYGQACAVKLDDTVWCWGYGGHGQVGNGANATVYVPTQVSYDEDYNGTSEGFLTGVKSVASNGWVNCAVKLDKSVYCWGYNGYGSLGDGTTTNRNYAVPMKGFDGAKLMTATGVSIGDRRRTTIMVNLDDGTVASIGHNELGENGINTLTAANYPLTRVNFQLSGSGGGIADSSITNAHLQDNSVSTSKIQDGAVTLSKVNFASTTEGLVIPVMTEVQRDAVAAPVEGMILINNTSHELNMYENSAWKSVGGGGGSLTANSVATSHITNGAVTVDKIDLSSSTSGLTFANMTKTQRDAIAAPADGMMIYNTDSKSMNVYSNGQWVDLGSGGLSSAFTQVSSGLSMTCAIKSGKTVDCWGDGGSGRLGHNSTASSSIPVSVRTTTGDLLRNIDEVSAAGAQSCALDSNDEVYCWGLNTYGILGDGTTTNSLVAKKVPGLSNVKTISSGTRHICAVLNDGTVKCWGSGGNGQLGNGGVANSYVPTFANITGVKSVEAGGLHTCAIKTDDTLWCWGYNNVGQLGNGNNTQQNNPVQVMTGVASVSAGGSWSDWNNTTCAVKLDGTVWCTGYGGHGQIGNDAVGNKNVYTQVTYDSNVDGASDGFLTNVTKVEANNYYVCASKVDKTLWCWGHNGNNNLGDGTTTNRDSAIQMKDFDQTGFLTNVEDFALSDHAGSRWTAILLSDGTIASVGNNTWGQLGNNSTTNSTKLVRVYTDGNSSGGSLAQNSVDTAHYTDGSITDIKLQGLNPTGCANGEVIKTDGLGGFYCSANIDMTDPNFSAAPNPLGMPVLTTVARDALVAAAGKTIYNSDTNQIEYYNGALWQSVGTGGTTLPDFSGSTNPLGLPVLTTVERDALTPTAGMLIWNSTNSQTELFDGSVWGPIGSGGGSTGDFTSSATGVTFPPKTTAERDAIVSPAEGSVVYNTDSDSLNVYTNGAWSDMKTDISSIGFVPSVTKTAGSGQSYCSLMSDKTVRCWGYNGYGVVGNGNTTNTAAPSVVIKADGNPLNNAVDIDMGRYHACAATDLGEVYCWGYNGNYELGLGDTTHRYYANKVPGITTATDIATAWNSTCAVLADDTLKCWGYNAWGQVGDGTTVAKPSPVVNGFVSNVKELNGGRGYYCALKNDNNLWCWGYNDYGQLGNGGTTNSTTAAVLTLTGVKDFDAGSSWHYTTAHYYYSHMCAVKTDDTVWCWGYGGHGQTGNGATSTVYVPTQVSYDEDYNGTSEGFLTGVDSVSSNGWVNCAVKLDKSLYCWGYNAWGQLGDGTTTNRSYAVPMKGFDGTKLMSATGVSIGIRRWDTIMITLDDGTLASIGYNETGENGINTTAGGFYPLTRVQFSINSGVGGSIVDSSISNAHLQDNSVSTSKIQDGAVTIDKIDFSTATKGLVIPKMTEVARDAITPNVDGMILLNTTTNDVNVYTNSSWKVLGGGAGALTANSVQTSHIDTGAVTLDKIDLTSTTSGLTFSNMTKAQRDAIAAPQEGMVIYNSDTKGLNVYSNGQWVEVGSGGGLNSAFLAADSGAYYTCSIMSGKTVQCWGYNGNGELGINNTTNSYVPVTVRKLTGEVLPNIDKIEASRNNSCALDGAGDVWCWGYNGYGDLGDGTTASKFAAQKVPGLSGVIDIAVGGRHACAVLTDNSVKCWGNNANGQFGNNSVSNSYTPVFSNMTGAKKIFAGGGHTCAIKTDDTFWCWGYNGYGQVGDNSTVQKLTPVQILTGVKDAALASSTNNWINHTCAVKLDDTLWCWGRGGEGQLANDAVAQSNVPVQATFDANGDGVSDGVITNVAKVAADNRVTCAIKHDNTMWCAGANSHYNLGDGTVTNRDSLKQVVGIGGVGTLAGVVDVTLSNADGNRFTTAILLDGTAVSWGYNGYGNLGDNSTTARTLPQRVHNGDDGSNGLAVDSVSTPHIMDDAITDTKLTGLAPAGCAVNQIIKTDGLGGFFCSSAIDLNDPNFKDATGVLGLPQKTTAERDAIAPVYAGFTIWNTTTAQMEIYNGSLWQAGGGGAGGSADFSAAGTGLSLPQLTTASRDALTPNAGDVIYNTTTGQQEMYDGSSWVAVNTSGGNTGDYSASSTGVVFPQKTTAERDALTANEGMVVYNTESQSLNVYSNGTWTDMKTDLSSTGFVPSVIKTAGSGQAYCALLSDKSVRCWGYNGHGILGNGNTTNSGTPNIVIKADGSPLNNAVDLDLGRYHACAATDLGEVYCWGYNGNKRLGLGDTTNRYYATKVSGITNATNVATADESTCALLADGTLKCWGYNGWGQVGDGTTVEKATPVVNTFVNNVKKISGGRGYYCAQKNDDSLWCWGYNDYGQLGNGGTTTSSTAAVLTMTNVKNFDAGSAWHWNGTTHYYYSQVCAVKNDDTAWCWGYGGHGQVGNGATATVYVPTQVSYDEDYNGTAEGFLTGVDSISSNGWVNCAVKLDKSLYCWGYNAWGQLGDGTTTNRSYAIPMKGFDGTKMMNVTGVSQGIRRWTTIMATLDDGTVASIGYNETGENGGNTTAGGFFPLTRVRFNTSGGATIVDSSITNAHLQDNSVSTTKVQDGAITLDKLSLLSTTDTIVIPYMTQAQRDAIAAEEGMVLINTTDHTMNMYEGGAWKTVGGGGAALTTNSVVTTHITDGAITADKIDLSDVTTGLTFGNLTTAQRDAIVGPLDGMVIYNTDQNSLNVFSNGVWKDVGSSAGINPVYTDVKAASHFSCALKSDKTMECWGYNGNGALGNNQTTNQLRPVEVRKTNGEILSNVSQFENFNHSVCAVTTDKKVYCWGYNGYGQLGDGTTTNSLTAKRIATITNAVKVTGGARHACALLDDGTVMCWGTGTSGQHGNNSTSNSFFPVFSNIGSVKDISSGSGYNCAIKTDDSLWCWGHNAQGQIGNGNTTNQLLPVQVMTGVKSVATSTLNSAWNSTTCAIKLDNTLWCWGEGSNGQLGNDAVLDSTTPVQVTVDTNGDGGADALMANVHKVDVDGYSACAILADTSAWCWGYNNYGQLADGTVIQRDSARQVVGMENIGTLSGVSAVSLSDHQTYHHATFLLQNGKVVSIGYNAYGNMGDNSTTNRRELTALYSSNSGAGELATQSIANQHYAENSISDNKLLGLGTGCGVGQVIKTDGFGGFFCFSLDNHSLDSADGSINDALFVDNVGNVGIGNTVPSEKLEVTGNIKATGAIKTDTGVKVGTGSLYDHDLTYGKAEVTYALANGYCPAGRAIQVPKNWAGKTGNEICAADTATDGAKTTCVAQKYAYSTVSGSVAPYATNDISCSTPNNAPWPWLEISGSPNSRPDEWANRTYIVCCQ